MPEIESKVLAWYAGERFGTKGKTFQQFVTVDGEEILTFTPGWKSRFAIGYQYEFSMVGEGRYKMPVPVSREDVHPDADKWRSADEQSGINRRNARAKKVMEKVFRSAGKELRETYRHLDYVEKRRALSILIDEVTTP